MWVGVLRLDLIRFAESTRVICCIPVQSVCQYLRLYRGNCFCNLSAAGVRDVWSTCIRPTERRPRKGRPQRRTAHRDVAFRAVLGARIDANTKRQPSTRRAVKAMAVRTNGTVSESESKKPRTAKAIRSAAMRVSAEFNRKRPVEAAEARVYAPKTGAATTQPKRKGAAMRGAFASQSIGPEPS